MTSNSRFNAELRSSVWSESLFYGSVQRRKQPGGLSASSPKVLITHGKAEISPLSDPTDTLLQSNDLESVLLSP